MDEMLALGSVVLLNGNGQKVMIVSRGVGIRREGGQTYYDYAACRYPEGMIDDKLIFFDRDGVAKVLHEGYRDDSSEVVEHAIQKWKQQQAAV